MTETTDTAEPPIAGWRLKLGVAVFVASVILPLGGIPLVASAGLSGSVTASVSGALLVSAEVLGFAAIAIMGKPGFVFIKGQVLRHLKRIAPTERVGRARYNVGLVLFCIPLVTGWLYPYAKGWFPHLVENLVAYSIGGDLLLVASFFVLGGDFWEKIRALFVYDTRVVRTGG